MSEVSRILALANNNPLFVFFAGLAQPLFGFGGFALAVPHFRVKAFFLQKFGMRTALNDFTRFQNNNLIRIDNGR